MIDWHFPRLELANSFLAQFESGITSALTLFAPRRMGKTEFLLYDLAPEAEKQGYQVIYCSFWEIREDPVKSLLLAIEDSQKKQTWVERLKQLGKSPVSSVEIGLPSSSFKVSAKSELRPKKLDADALEQVATVLNDSGKDTGKRVLFLLDEVQHLATDKAFLPLVSLLRTVFEKYSKRFQVVYTGSSRDGLKQLFKKRNAPLFHSSQQIDLPKLGAPFIHHMLTAFEQASGRKLSFVEAHTFFNKVNAVPYLFHSLLKQLLISGMEFTDVADVFLEEISEESEYKLTWEQLSPMDKAVLEWVATNNKNASADNSNGIYAKKAKEFLCQELGLEDIPRYAIQNSVNRLRKRGILGLIEYGVLAFEDEYFLEWIKSNA